MYGINTMNRSKGLELMKVDNLEVFKLGYGIYS